MDKKCVVCDNMFSAKRTDARFCSDKCRKSYSRQLDEDVSAPVDEAINADKLYDDNGQEIDSEGFPLDHTKFTQEQVEAYYTLERFPSRQRYYSLNGGGSGALSPYGSSDPRHAAYILK